MQALRPPYSLRDSSELKTTSSRKQIHEASCSCPPIIIPPGADHLNNLLSCKCQTAPDLHTSTHDLNYQHDDSTFVYPFHSFQSLLTTQILEDEAQIAINNTHYTTKGRLACCSTTVNRLDKIKPSTTTRSLSMTDSYDALGKLQNQDSRTLTRSFDRDFNVMTAVVGTPGSPPDLVDSRSSKSSSYDSQFSVTDDASHEIINFEDIALEDDRRPEQNKAVNIPTPSSSAESQSPSFYKARSLTSRQGKNLVDNVSKPLPGTTMRTGFTSPSMLAISQQDTNAAFSSNRLPRSTSTTSLSQISLTGFSGRPPFAPTSRRSSWQPRKTIKEIEAEFHDSDDELPEDASLWNVPISPFPSGDHSARSSARGSPNRGPLYSPQPLPLEHIRSHPDSPPYQGPPVQSLPRRKLTVRSSSVNPSQLSSTSPRVSGALRNSRTKSWNVAMTELSEDARILSQNLEYHADRQSKGLEQQTAGDKWFSNVAQRSSAPSLIQLPPVQRGALDFMPISKEKEAILSRTRPSWLPPKDPQEEKKHLKEYQRMMAASIEAEKKRETLQKNTPTQQDDTHTRLNRIWNFYVDPTTDLLSIDRRVRDLCWRGINPHIRGKVWQRTIGNPLGLSKRTYARALERAKEVKGKKSADLNRHEKSLAASFTDIERDAETAFPELNLFQRSSPLWQDLIDVCEAHACYRDDIGHLYGIQLIGALMLLQIPDPADAFILLENCLNHPVPLAFQTGDVSLTQRTYGRVTSTLGIKFPRLHDYLFDTPEAGGLGLSREAVLEPMFRTMFSNGLDIDRLCRVWDIWMFEGDRTLVKTAVAILGSLQQQIFDVEGDLDLKRRNVQEMLGWGPFNRTKNGSYWQLQSLGDEESFVEGIRTAGKLDYTGR